MRSSRSRGRARQHARRVRYPCGGLVADLYLLDGAAQNMNESHRDMSAEIKKEIQLEIAVGRQ